MVNRRSFIKTSSLLGVVTAALPLSNLLLASPKKLNILIMGGTGFLGPHTVNAALAQGHTVTLFNRGKTNPGLFSQLETIIGDRNTSDIQKLVGRQWDAVIDTSAYFPRSVNSVLEVLEGNIKQYLIVSTISVYADTSIRGMDETSPTGKTDSPDTEEITDKSYGPLKALCEQAAEKHMPGRVCVIRPGLIVGPGDKTDRFTYWPVRIKRGGKVLAPGSGKDFIQYIDVRDLGEWMIYCLNHNIAGTYNAQTNAADLTIGRLLETCVEILNPKAELVWVPADFLKQHQVSPWQDMPAWLPNDGAYAGMGSMSSTRAYNAGLKEKPIGTVITDCYEWFTSLPAERQGRLRAGLSLERELAILKLWNKHKNKI